MSAEPEVLRWLDGLADAAGEAPEPTQALDERVAEVVAELTARRRRRRALIVAGLAAATLLFVAWRWIPARFGVEATSIGAHEAAAAVVDRAEEPQPTVSRQPESAPTTARRRAKPPVLRVEQEIEAVPPPNADEAKPVEPPRRPKKKRHEPTAAELMARAQQSRAARDAAAAREALIAVRDRFPKHTAAERATFLLGRVEQELAGRPEQALAWFERYIEQYPNGRFVGQARGRVVRHRASHGPAARAREAADDYLAHHADGPYAELARRVATER